MKKFFCLMLVLILLFSVSCSTEEQVDISTLDGGQTYDHVMTHIFTSGTVSVKQTTEADVVIEYNGDKADADSNSSMTFAVDLDASGGKRYTAHTGVQGNEVTVSRIKDKVYYDGDLSKLICKVTDEQADQLFDYIKICELDNITSADFENIEKTVNEIGGYKLICSGLDAEKSKAFADRYSYITEVSSNVTSDIKDCKVTVFIGENGKVSRTIVEVSMDIRMISQSNEIGIISSIKETTDYTYGADVNISAPEDTSQFENIEFTKLYPNLE